MKLSNQEIAVLNYLRSAPEMRKDYTSLQIATALKLKEKKVKEICETLIVKGAAERIGTCYKYKELCW